MFILILKIKKITGYKNFKNIEREIPLIIKWFKENNIPYSDEEYWELDLASKRLIGTITYYGRSDSSSERITGVRFEVSNSPRPRPFSSISVPSSWNDKSYYSHLAAQAASSKQPQFIIDANNSKVIRFDGVNDNFIISK